MVCDLPEVLKALRKETSQRERGSRVGREKSQLSGQRRSHLCPRTASCCDGTCRLKKTRRRRQSPPVLNSQHFSSWNEPLVDLVCNVSEWRSKKLLLTKNQQCPSLDGRFGAEGQWYFQINSRDIGVCFFPQQLYFVSFLISFD